MTKEQLDKIAEVMRTAAELNTKTKHAIFVNFHGHVNTMNVEVCRDKRGGYTVVDYKYEIDLDKPTESEFNKVIKRLNSFL